MTPPDPKAEANMSYKALAPRPAYSRPHPDPTTPPHLKSKPTPKVACETCRNRKTACDGKRPSCSKCTRKLLPCRYSTTGERLKQRVQDLQSSLDSHIELVNLLSSTSEENIVQVLRDLKAAPEPLAYLETVKGDLDMQQQQQQQRRASTDTSVTGSTHSLSRVDREFDELTARYQIAYPVLPPMQVTSIDPRPRFAVPAFEPGAGQRLLFDMGAARLSSPSTLLQAPLESTDFLGNLTANLACRLRPSSRQIDSSPWPEPVTQSSYIDERLHHLKIDYWTSVPVSNSFAATAISAYLEIDHPCYGFFDVDLFLHDLVNLGITFCSPFLVSSILAQACYTCAAIDSRTLALGQAFLEEAERLYRAERMSDLLPNASALAIFSMVCTLQCREELASETQQLSRQMGQRMRLFGVVTEESNWTHFNNMPSYIKVSSAQTAWGLYNWLSLRTLFYDSKAIEYPPILPIPGEHHEKRRDTMSNLEWPEHFLPGWMGRAFSSHCRLWVLAQEIAAVYFVNQQKPLIERVSLAFAESKYTKLLEWVATLGPELKRREQNTPVDTLLFQHRYLTPGTHSADSSPGAIYEASINQMKHIVLQHHLEWPDKLVSNFAYAGYMQLCSTMAAGSGLGPDITRTQRREQRFYFDICMCFFQDAYLQHALALPIAQSLLSIALENRLIRASKARQILQGLEERGSHHPHHHDSSPSLLRTNTRAQIIVHFELSTVDVDASRAHALASKLEDLVLFDEFTNTTTTTTTTTTSDNDEDEDSHNHEEDGDSCENDNYNEHGYESSAPSGSVVSPDLYRTPASDVCTDYNNCWMMDGCDGG
ncbi:nitrate assimilation regulatory protein nirA [Apiospora saccharicola]|uniref:Nitrate assimilation regulatory protein nirA n=1 Tax=Apiospora saccharicola TaxID=335842 RepID=A0ABR1UF47_9PEZI